MSACECENDTARVTFVIARSSGRSCRRPSHGNQVVGKGDAAENHDHNKSDGKRQSCLVLSSKREASFRRVPFHSLRSKFQPGWREEIRDFAHVRAL